MAYQLSTTIPDQVVISGRFVSSGKDWANVFKGMSTSAVPTSTDLLTAVSNAFAGALPNISDDVRVDQYECRQITGTAARLGRLFRVQVNVSGGVIMSVTILDPGAGYVNGSRFYTVFDPSPGAGGASLQFTFTGNALTSVAVMSGGNGYTTPTVSPSLPDLVPGNDLVFTFGASDFTLVSQLGGVGTDRSPSFDAFSIRMRSTRPGRYGRSSAHWPGVPEASTTKDALTVTAAITAAASQLYGQTLLAPADQWRAKTVSLAEIMVEGYQGLPIPAGLISSITTVVCNPNVGSMVRRKVRLH